MSRKRSIFQEVSGDAAAGAAVQPGMIDRGRGGARRGIRLWLMVIFALVVAMIALGGLTRLTDSGLSITEWRPVTGAIPPLSAADWQAEFDRYRQIDEWRVQNRWMALSDFQVIYWWEWSHRQLGRLIGLVWAVGFFGFLAARRIPAGWTGRLILPGALGAVQGGVGWWMVSSGVTHGQGVLDVASYRLAIHLGLAFVILGVVAWQVFQLGRSGRDLMQARRANDAGLMRTDWPLMGGQILPPDATALQPLWRNFFESPGLVQWIHRSVGYLVLVFGVVVWLRGRRSPHPATRAAFNVAAVVVIAQIVLGVTTVLTGASWQIAIVHQIVAVALWVTVLRARFRAAYPIVTSLREGRA